MHLIDLGWDPFFEQHFEPYRTQGLSAMRIIRENRGVPCKRLYATGLLIRNV